MKPWMNWVIFSAVVVIGACITMAIDGYLGIDWEEFGISRTSQFFHEIAYLIWGGLLMFATQRLKQSNKKTDSEQE